MIIRRTAVTAAIGVLLFTVLAACGLLNEPEAPSGTIEAIPLEIATAEIPAEVTIVNQQEEPAEPMPTVEEVGEDIDASAKDDPDSGGAGLVIFTIDPEKSEVRFELDEDLSGIRNTVVGTTNQVAGEIALDTSDLATLQVGTILVNARTLATDNDLRNRTIQNRILNTGSYEFISFAPTAIEGLPESIGPGDSVNFTIAGDLTVRDVTKPVTFDVEATMVSESEFSGTASSTVSHEELGLSIPEVPRVANVEEEVELYIDFVATAG